MGPASRETHEAEATQTAAGRQQPALRELEPRTGPTVPDELPPSINGRYTEMKLLADAYSRRHPLPVWRGR